YSHTAAAGLIYAGLGGVSYEQNDLPAAAAYLAEGLQRTDSALADIAPIHAAPCLFGMLKTHTALGGIEEAEAILTRLEQIARATPAASLDPLLTALEARR